MQGTGSQRLVLHIWLLLPPFFCAILPFAASRAGKGWTHKLLSKKKSVQSIPMHFIPAIAHFSRVNHSANCQSAGRQIDPISLIFAGYLSCAPEGELWDTWNLKWRKKKMICICKNIPAYRMSWACKRGAEASKNRSAQLQRNRRKCDKTGGGKRKNYGYFGRGDLPIMLEYLGLIKLSHWLFVMENAPLRVDPGNFSPSL